MPLYEYHCKTCGEVFETVVRWSEDGSSPICPRCQSQHTQKRTQNQPACTGSSGSSQSAGDYSSSFASRRRFV